MNFLQLCQRAVTDCGASGTLVTTAGSQPLNLQRIINWVGDAWNEIQTAHDDWDWMRSSGLLGGGASFVPAAGQYRSAIGTGAGTVGVSWADFGKWDRETFRCFTTTAGTSNEQFLDWVPYDTWRDSYMLGAMRQVQTRPVAFTIGTDQSINLGPPPNGLYTITGDYFRAPSAMVDDDDVPEWLPARFHMLIVYKAMLKYAGYESAMEVFERASMEWNGLYPQLEAGRLPEASFAGALA